MIHAWHCALFKHDDILRSKSEVRVLLEELCRWFSCLFTHHDVPEEMSRQLIIIMMEILENVSVCLLLKKLQKWSRDVNIGISGNNTLPKRGFPVVYHLESFLLLGFVYNWDLTISGQNSFGRTKPV